MVVQRRKCILRFKLILLLFFSTASSLIFAQTPISILPPIDEMLEIFTSKPLETSSVSSSNLRGKFSLEGGGNWIAAAPFDGKIQGQTTLSYSLQKFASEGEIEIFSDTGLSLTYKFPSNLSGGYNYQGMFGVALDLGGGVFFESRSLGSLEITPSLAGILRNGLYRLNTAENYLFFFSLIAEPAIEIKVSESWPLIISLPITWDLRWDTDLSLGAGLKIGMIIPMKGGK